MTDQVRACPFCGRMSERVAWGQSCPYCYRLAGPVERILSRWGPRILTALTIGVIALIAGILIGEARADDTIRLTTIDVGGVKWTTGTIGDDTVNLLSNDVGGAEWTTGTIGDDSVNLLGVEYGDTKVKHGTIGDTRVDILEYSLFDDETDED